MYIYNIYLLIADLKIISFYSNLHYEFHAKQIWFLNIIFYKFTKKKFLLNENEL